MPKQKPHKGLGKRVKVTGTGKVKRRRAFTGHLMSGKSGKRRRQLRQPKGLAPAMERNARRLLAMG